MGSVGVLIGPVLTLAGLLYPATSTAPSTQPAAAVQYDLPDQAWAEILAGQFDQANAHIRQVLDRNPDHPLVRTVATWLQEHWQLTQQRRQLRRRIHQKILNQARQHADQSDWAAAIKSAARALATADDREQFRRQPWLQQLVQHAAEHAESLRRRGQWLEATTMLSVLTEICPDQQIYKDRLRICRKHARLEAIYTSQNEPQWRDSLDRISPLMVRQALDQISLNYVKQPDFKRIAARGLESLLILAETPQLAEVFQSLASPDLVGQFTGRIRSLLSQIDEQSLVTSRTVYGWFQQVLTANQQTLRLPAALLVVEFMDGALESLDRFSSMIWPSEVSEFKKHTTGRFSGVGIQITLEDGQLMVVTPLEDTPAYEAGIQPGDVIVAIDGRSTKGITLHRAVRSITGPPGTTVVLTIRHRHSDRTIDIPITRAHIEVHTVKGYRRRDGSWDYLIDPSQRIAYIRLTSFMERTAQELLAALEQIRQQQARGLILDLRFNPGGLLRTAVEVADLFLDGGKTIVTTKGRTSPPWSQSANQPQVLPDLPLIVLLDQHSASASEIVAGAIRDHGRGLVIGQRSFGKASVQNLIPLADGSAYLKLTTALYYLPTGQCIDRQKNGRLWGVEPNITVELIPQEVSKVLQLRRKSDIIPGKAQASSDQQVDAPIPATSQAVTTSQPAEAIPDIDPQLETALLVMRVGLLSHHLWQTARAGEPTRLHKSD